MINTTQLRSTHPDLAPKFREALEEGATAAKYVRPEGFHLADALLEDACNLGASDIHIEPFREGARLRLRIDGAVRDIYNVSIERGKVLVNQIKAMAGLDPIVRFTPSDAHARYLSSHGQIDMRVALAPALDRDTVSIRLLDPRRLQRSINELGVRAENMTMLTEWLQDINGMFVATGPTGSGKTTTLYALLNSLRLSDKVIISLEDPVEYQMDGISQIQIDSLHNFEFADGIKAMLRHDPDYLMVGEIRDAASAYTAVSAAIAGRVLLSTMHSRDCVGAITALRNWGLRDHEIAESLSVVVTQRLVRKLCTNCTERLSPTPEQTAWFHSLRRECPHHFWESIGCDKCHNLGFKGRTGVFELWRLDEDDHRMIMNNTDEHGLRRWLESKKHPFLLNEALDLLCKGVTPFEEVRKVAAGTLPPSGMAETKMPASCAEGNGSAEPPMAVERGRTVKV